MRHGLAVAIVVVVLSLMPARVLTQQVVWDNGKPDGGIGGGVSAQYWTMNDFTLTSSATLSFFDWYVHPGVLTQTPSLSANYTWAILADLGDLSSAISIGNVIAGIGSTTSYSAYQDPLYLFRAALGVTLNPGMYYLAIGQFAPANCDPTASYLICGGWASSFTVVDPNYPTAALGNEFLFRPFDPDRTMRSVEYTFAEGAFTIYSGPVLTATPEPASIVLMGTGLAAVAGRLRRRRRLKKSTTAVGDT